MKFFTDEKRESAEDDQELNDPQAEVMDCTYLKLTKSISSFVLDLSTIFKILYLYFEQFSYFRLSNHCLYSDSNSLKEVE